MTSRGVAFVVAALALALAASTMAMNVGTENFEIRDAMTSGEGASIARATLNASVSKLAFGVKFEEKGTTTSLTGKLVREGPEYKMLLNNVAVARIRWAENELVMTILDAKFGDRLCQPTRLCKVIRWKPVLQQPAAQPLP